MTIIKICAAYKEASQRQKPSYAHMTRIKKAEELLYMDVVGFISSIDHNRARFIIYNINNIFRMHFGEYIKEKEEISKILRAWIAYLENYIKHSVQCIYLNNSKEYAKLKMWIFKKNILIKPTVPYSLKINRLIEINNKMIIIKIRSILIDAELLKKF